MTLKQLLEQRGIFGSATAAGWQEASYRGRPGWSFPVYHYRTGQIIGYRWKAADGGQPKYIWLSGKPADPAADWYILPDTADAIAAAGGEVYLANGEPALLAYRAAGVHNVITTTASEITVPRTAVEVLRELGVARLVYPVDNDAAGEQSGKKWRDALSGTGIDYEALSWGDHAPPKGDANDVWQQCGFDRDAFMGKFPKLTPLSLPVPKPKPILTTTYDGHETPDDLITLLAQRLDVTSWKSDGWSRGNVCCPHHDDNKPSAGLNRDSGVLHCFVCGSHSPQATAEQLGIDWKRFYPERQPQQWIEQAPRPAPAPEPELEPVLDFPNGLPDPWQGALAKYAPRHVAPVVHGIVDTLRDGELDPRGYTVAEVEAQLVKRSICFSKHSIRQVLESEFVKLLDDIERDEILLSRNSTKGGRPARFYRLKPRWALKDVLLAYAEPRLIEENHVDDEGNEILARPTPAFIEQIEGDTANLKRLQEILEPVLAGDEKLRGRAEARVDYRYEQLYCALDSDLVVTPLPSNWPIASMTDYHAARLNARLYGKEERAISRRELCEMVACSNGLLDNVMAQAGVESRDNHQTITFERVTAVQLAVRDFCRANCGQPYAVVIKSQSGRIITEYGYRDIHDLQATIDSEVPKGRVVVLKVRCASLRRVTQQVPVDVVADTAAEEKVASVRDVPKAPAKPRRKPYRGREHHPEWRLDQLRLALAGLGKHDLAVAETIVDAETGEVIPDGEREQTLLAAVLGERDIRCGEEPLGNFPRENMTTSEKLPVESELLT